MYQHTHFGRRLHIRTRYAKPDAHQIVTTQAKEQDAGVGKPVHTYTDVPATRVYVHKLTPRN